jgi:hypothetical protein
VQGLDIGEHGASCYPDFVMTGGGSFSAPMAAASREYASVAVGSEQPAES